MRNKNLYDAYVNGNEAKPKHTKQDKKIIRVIHVRYTHRETRGRNWQSLTVTRETDVYMAGPRRKKKRESTAPHLARKRAPQHTRRSTALHIKRKNRATEDT